jgi:hypothetical protein
VQEKTLDNVTAVLIGFKNIEEMFDKQFKLQDLPDKPIESMMDDENLIDESNHSAMQKLLKPLE